MNAGRGSRRPCSAASAGRTNSSKQTRRTRGCPGSRRRACARGLPKRQRLARLQRDPPEELPTPSSRAISRTRSCPPTDTPPVLNTTSCASARRMRRAVRIAGVRSGRDQRHLGARAGQQRRATSDRWSHRSAPARAARPAATARCRSSASPRAAAGRSAASSRPSERRRRSAPARAGCRPGAPHRRGGRRCPHAGSPSRAAPPAGSSIDSTQRAR